MADEPDPPRKYYRLTEPTFERVNPPVAAAPMPPAAAAAPLGATGVAPVNRPNEVHALLALNRDRERAAGGFDVSVRPKRKSRRRRDYFVVLILGNALLVGAIRLQPVFGGAGFVLFNIGLTWIMWVVMDDY